MPFFKLKQGKPIWLEYLEQSLHVAEAAMLFHLILFPTPIWVAGLLSFAYGIRRELEQHGWDWRRIGRQDMFFWGSSSLACSAIYYWLSAAA